MVENKKLVKRILEKQNAELVVVQLGLIGRHPEILDGEMNPLMGHEPERYIKLANFGIKNYREWRGEEHSLVGMFNETDIQRGYDLVSERLGKYL